MSYLSDGIVSKMIMFLLLMLCLCWSVRMMLRSVSCVWCGGDWSSLSYFALFVVVSMTTTELVRFLFLMSFRVRWRVNVLWSIMLYVCRGVFVFS